MDSEFSLLRYWRAGEGARMATRKNVQLPKQWTVAKVRVNPQGKVQVKIAPSKVTVKTNVRKKKTRRRK